MTGVTEVLLLQQTPPAQATTTTTIAAPAALARLAHDPLGALCPAVAAAAAYPAAASGSSNVKDRLEALLKDAARAYQAATTPDGRDGALRLHAALLAAAAVGKARGQQPIKQKRRHGDDEDESEEEETGALGNVAAASSEATAGATKGGKRAAAVLRLLWEHTHHNNSSATAAPPPSPESLQTAHRVATFLLGRDHPRALSYLRMWARADPTSDAALVALVRAYRRQLLRAYVSGPVGGGRPVCLHV